MKKKKYAMIYNRYKQLNFSRKLCLDKFNICFPFCSSFSVFFVLFQKSSQTIYVFIRSSSTIFQSKSLGEAFPKVEGDGVSDHPLELSHTLNKGFPHNPGFPSNKLFGNVSNKLFGNVSNYFLYGISLVKWLLDTLKNAREVKDPRCLIILLVVR